MVDRRGVCTGFAVVLLATPALAASTFGEVCSGSEVLQVGSQPARTVPYHLEFSADLQTRSSCVRQVQQMVMASGDFGAPAA
jgi:hypothetical protein